MLSLTLPEPLEELLEELEVLLAGVADFELEGFDSTAFTGVGVDLTEDEVDDGAAKPSNKPSQGYKKISPAISRH